jgi:hypothetical protein
MAGAVSAESHLSMAPIPQQEHPNILIIPRNNHDIDVVILGSHGQVRLTVNHEGPTVMMHALGRLESHQSLAAAWTLLSSGCLRGWVARKDNQLEWFPARKQRAKKRALKKRTTKA